MRDQLDRILIKDLEVMGIIGINPSERVEPQMILINATLRMDTRPAAESDVIDDAANYRTLTKAMIRHIQEGEPQLVERLAQELVAVCFAVEPRIQEVELTVEKPGAVQYSRSVGITICRARGGEDG